MEELLTGLLLRKTFGGRKRMIFGTTNSANKTISCRVNNTYTYSGGSWSRSGGTEYSATSDSTGYFEIELPNNLVLHNFTFDSSYGASRNNPEYITSINLSYIGKVDQVNTLLFAFSNLTHVTSIAGFNKFSHSPIVTMEGCFRACEQLTSLDFTGMNTDDMVATSGATDGSQRYGFPNCFYDCVSLRSLTLPKIPSTCYMGEGTFYGCEALTNVSCSGSVANNLIMVTKASGITTDGPALSVNSLRDILSHLTTTPNTGAHCEFYDSAWYYVCNDSQCQSLVTTATSNGWSFIPTYQVYYFDDCNTYSHFHTSSAGHYLVGTEASTDTHPCSVVMGKAYLICNESSSVTTHDHAEYRFGSALNLSNATELHMQVKAFNYTGSESSGTGLVRYGLNTTDDTSTQITTSNNNFIVYIQWVDSSNRTTSWANDDHGTSGTTIAIQKYNESPQNLGSSITYTLSLPSSDFDKTNVIGFNIMYMKTTDSAKERKKGGWYNSIIIK